MGTYSQAPSGCLKGQALLNSAFSYVYNKIVHKRLIAISNNGMMIAFIDKVTFFLPQDTSLRFTLPPTYDVKD